MTTIKADIAAADRLLKAAVRKAREQIVEKPVAAAVITDHNGHVIRTIRGTYDRAAIVAMLVEATRSAELLLGERA